MNDPLDITEDEIERIKEWEAKHSIRNSVDGNR